MQGSTKHGSSMFPHSGDPSSEQLQSRRVVQTLQSTSDAQRRRVAWRLPSAESRSELPHAATESAAQHVRPAMASNARTPARSAERPTKSSAARVVVPCRVVMPRFALVLVAFLACCSNAPRDRPPSGAERAARLVVPESSLGPCAADAECRIYRIADACCGCGCRAVLASAPDPRCDRGPRDECGCVGRSCPYRTACDTATHRCVLRNATTPSPAPGPAPAPAPAPAPTPAPAPGPAAARTCGGAGAEDCPSGLECVYPQDRGGNEASSAGRCERPGSAGTRCDPAAPRCDPSLRCVAVANVHRCRRP